MWRTWEKQWNMRARVSSYHIRVSRRTMWPGGQDMGKSRNLLSHFSVLHNRGTPTLSRRFRDVHAPSYNCHTNTMTAWEILFRKEWFWWCLCAIIKQTSDNQEIEGAPSQIHWWIYAYETGVDYNWVLRINRPNLWRQPGCHWFDWQLCVLQARRTYLVWLHLWRSGWWNGHHFEDSIQIQLCRFSYQGRCKISVQHAVTVSSLRLILSDAYMEHTSWCSNGAYST